jgi:hypothetical protein
MTASAGGYRFGLPLQDMTKPRLGQRRRFNLKVTVAVSLPRLARTAFALAVGTSGLTP